MIVLTVGPNETPITGQSKCYNHFIKNTKHQVLNVFCNGNSKLYIFKYIYLIFYHRLFSKYEAIYFTSSRSKLGFIRDLVLVAVNYNRRNCLIVNHLHGADFKNFYDTSSLFLKKIVDFVYLRVDVSIVLTKGMKEQYLRYKHMKSVVVANYYDDSDIGAIREFKVNEPLEILFLSNLIPSKGYQELINTVNVINSMYDGRCLLHLAGAAFDANSRRFLLKTDLGHHVKYHGIVSGEKKVELLSRAHILALPTYYPTEAQPLSLIEGMASGCYLITTDHNYLPEFVGRENGSILNIRKDSFKKINENELLLYIKSAIEGDIILNDVMNYNYDYARKHFSSLVYISKIDEILEG